MPYRILRLLIFCLFTVKVVLAQTVPNLVVAWVDNGDVWVWRTATGESTQYTSGGAAQTFISPDGRYIAFTSDSPSGLWLITPDNTAPIEVVPASALMQNSQENVGVREVQWGANNTLYFDTHIVLPSELKRQDDFWSLDATTLMYQQIVPTPQAGVFHISPDGLKVAFAQPGTYDSAEGTIRLVELAGLKELNHFNFPAVSSGASYDFYPSVNWIADSQSVKVGIPQKALVYADASALTTLWQLSSDGTQTQIDTVQASIFGQPKWSDDGAILGYMRHKGDITTNEFDLMIAAGDGKNPIIYASGAAGSFGIPEWLTNSDQFIYPQGAPGEWWIGQPDQPPQKIPNKLYSPHFVDATTYVFGTTNGELRYSRLGSTDSVLIAKIRGAVPLFDARLIP